MIAPRSLLWKFLLVFGPWLPHTTALSSHGPILVVGATGGTGLRALKGLLDAGCQPSQIRLLTRNPDSDTCQALASKLGFQIVRADLDQEDPTLLQQAVQDCVGCYLHALQGDTREVTLGGDVRAQKLVRAIRSSAAPGCHVVMNSAAAEDEHGVDRIAQMHRIEDVFSDSQVPFTSLRANLFMEELWKKYTRPAILKGKFSFSVPSDRELYLTSVKDMGQLAGTCLLESLEIGQKVNVAGDCLKASEIATIFGQAQPTPCKHSQGRIFALFCKFFFKDLYQIIRFYRTSTETTNLDGLQQKFSFGLTDLATFLDETEWQNEEKSYQDFGDVNQVLLAETTRK